MRNPDIKPTTYLYVAIVFALLFALSVAIIGSQALNGIFGMVAIATMFMAIAQSWVNQQRA